MRLRESVCRQRDGAPHHRRYLTGASGSHQAIAVELPQPPRFRGVANQRGAAGKESGLKTHVEDPFPQEQDAQIERATVSPAPEQRPGEGCYRGKEEIRISD